MPRKTRRRPIRRRPPNRNEDLANRQRSTDAAARSLLHDRTAEELHSELHDRELLLQEADGASRLDPGPEGLARYRAARSQVEIIRRALELSSAEI